MSSVASLLDSQLTPKQQQLLAAILYPVIRQDLNEAATWSQWSFARSTLRKEQLDADQIATSLPRLDATLEFPEYGLIWRDTPMASSQIQRREKVGLTMAGLYRTDPDSADRIARLIGWCADREDALEPDPDGMTEESLDFNSMLTNCLAGQLRFGNGSLNAQTVAGVLMREPIRVQVLITSGQWIYRLPIGDGDPTVCRCDRRSRIPTRPGTGRWTRPRRLRQRSIKQHIRAAAKPHDTAAARSSRNASCRADCSSSRMECRPVSRSCGRCW